MDEDSASLVALNLSLQISTLISYLSHIIIIYFCLFKLPKLLNFIYRITIRPRKDLLRRYGKDTYAVITGSTEGLGKEIAKQLAKTGFNIILVARNKNKLKEFSSELIKEYKIKAEYIVFDFNNNKGFDYYNKYFSKVFNNWESNCSSSCSSLSNLSSCSICQDTSIKDNKENKEKKIISILVNNVGCLVPKRIIDLSSEECMRILNVNCTGMLYLNKIFIDSLCNNKPKNSSDDHETDNKKVLDINGNGRKAIISISSISAEFTMPYFNIYSATKIFVDFITKKIKYDLCSDVRNNNCNIDSNKLDVLSVRPCGIATNLSNMKNNFFTATSTYNVTNSILDSLGYEEETNGYWFHCVTSHILHEIKDFSELVVVFMSKILFYFVFQDKLKDKLENKNENKSKKKQE